MGTPKKARNRKYDIDQMMKDYLASMANKSHFDERCRFIQQQASHGKAKLTAGWQRRLLMDLIFPEPTAYHCENPDLAPKLPKKERPAMLVSDLFSQIVRAQKNRCYLCDKDFSESRLPSREHVVPVAKGGKNDRNILAACSPCNSRKGDRMPFACETLFLAGVHAILAKSERRSVRCKPSASYINPAFESAQSPSTGR